MQTSVLLLVYCICVVLSSLAGGALPSLVRLTHRRMQLVMSFVGGLMLGVALLHLLPHALAELGDAPHAADYALGWTLGGLLVMFLLIRVFHVHAHEHGDTSDVTDEHHHDHDHEAPCDHPHHAHVHETGTQHAHHHDHGHEKGPAHTHAFSWVGLAFGLSLHTLIDGLALGAAVAAENH